ncbi:AAA family ATPase [Pseudoruminococcus massiliensis]|uniref:AAA family ATPase n=1 Tax=Pseudoruminococcus massiliensis TaxID=2086583 RepID=UPI003AB345E1
MAKLKIINMDEVPVEEVKWLWYPYIPFGKLTIIHGDGGEGKTTLILQLAALLSRGEKLPCDDTEREPIKIIYQTAEDGLGDTIKPRLLSGNADCTKIKVIDESEAALTMLDERVEQAIAETGARVIILDPMQAYIGAKVDMNRANEVRNILAHLGRIAEKYCCAIILVGHLNKAQGNKSTYRGLGSIDFQATARSVIVVGRVKDKPEIRVAAHQKSSLAPEGKPIAFELSEANGFRWLGHYDITIDNLLCGVSREKKSDIAERLITDCLSDGKYPQQILLKKAQNAGISKRVLDEAKKSLGVKSIKESSGWYWELPEEKEASSF